MSDKDREEIRFSIATILRYSRTFYECYTLKRDLGSQWFLMVSLYAHFPDLVSVGALLKELQQYRINSQDKISAMIRHFAGEECMYLRVCDDAGEEIDVSSDDFKLEGQKSKAKPRFKAIPSSFTVALNGKALSASQLFVRRLATFRHGERVALRKTSDNIGVQRMITIYNKAVMDYYYKLAWNALIDDMQISGKKHKHSAFNIIKAMANSIESFIALNLLIDLFLQSIESTSIDNLHSEMEKIRPISFDRLRTVIDRYKKIGMIEDREGYDHIQLIGTYANDLTVYQRRLCDGIDIINKVIDNF